MHLLYTMQKICAVMHLLYTMQKSCAVMHLLYAMQKNCGGNLVPNMCCMLCDINLINVMRIVLMCNEAWLYARGTYVILVNAFIMR